MMQVFGLPGHVIRIGRVASHLVDAQTQMSRIFAGPFATAAPPSFERDMAPLECVVHDLSLPWLPAWRKFCPAADACIQSDGKCYRPAEDPLQ